MRKIAPAYRDWRRTVTQNMPHLSKPQAIGLALWSFGIALTHSCGLSTVSGFLAELLSKPDNSVRQQLREWYKEAREHDGRRRAQLDVTQSFAPLLKWVFRLGLAQQQQLILAADASTLGDRFVLLVISVVYCGCGIPVAWKILPGNQKGAWKVHWLKLLQLLQPAVPEACTVLVLTDRGLYAKWFYDAIAQYQWHPFMRIKANSYCQRQGSGDFQQLHQLIDTVGQHWSGPVRCFRANPLDCTLLGSWTPGHAEPWLILTDLAPQQADSAWYGMRSWIEALFKDLKRGGLQWQHSRMRDPQRAERLWLAIAVATLWLVCVGGPQKPEATPDQSSASEAPKGTQQSPRLLSCFRRGFLRLIAAAVRGLALPQGCLIPETWPCLKPAPT